jgi:tRNA threonylcarbamoyladenosine biosynthesis protein TsaE
VLVVAGAAAAAAAAAESDVTSFEVASEGSLTNVASALCADLGPGDVVFLEGPIGAGKTTLVQACAEQLGVTEPVTSPTFALAHRYAGRCPVAHLDLYRLEGQPVRDTDVLLEYVAEDAITFIEWPDIGSAWLPPATRVVSIRIDASARRTFTIERPRP